MLIVMHHQASSDQIRAVKEAVEAMGLRAEPIPGSERTAIGVLGNHGYVDDASIRELAGVREVIHVSKPYKLVSRDFHPAATVVDAGGVPVGDGHPPVVIAGPCSIETEEQIIASAHLVKAAGGQILRGGAFKPRTGPHSFQGLGLEGLKLLRLAGDAAGLPVITEVMRIEQLEAVCRYADILQIGARNMQNFDLLKEVGKLHRPVLLKRGLSATIEEFLAAAEYIVAEGNGQVILCERGHSHLRARHPQHPRPVGHSAGAGDEPPADHRRSESRHRQTPAGADHGQGRPGGRGARHHGRSPPRSGPGAVRRCAESSRRWFRDI